MINTLSLLLGLAGAIVVCIRALMLDRTLPWFKPAPMQAKPPAGRRMVRR